MKNLNWTYIIIALILGISIVSYQGLNNFQKQEELRYKTQQEAKKQTQIDENIKNDILTPTEKPFEQPVSAKSSTVGMLNQCLNAASAENQQTNGALISWAEQNNTNGERDLSGAFDSIKTEYERDRQDCFLKYPQN